MLFIRLGYHNEQQRIEQNRILAASGRRKEGSESGRERLGNKTPCSEIEALAAWLDGQVWISRVKVSRHGASL